MTHDSSFREPAGEIVKNNIFPPVPFPEIPNSISSSPGWEVHEFLRTKINIQKDDATLLLGVD